VREEQRQGPGPAAAEGLAGRHNTSLQCLERMHARMQLPHVHAVAAGRTKGAVPQPRVWTKRGTSLVRTLT
jgi:hypothetical protein